jgi:hypothetical protein
MTKRGTCPVCFREFDVLDDGTLHRHGWSETGGTRRKGEYGNVWHSGSCYGTDFAPFEVSPEGTWSYLERVVFPTAMNIENVLTRLSTRPTLTVHYEFKERGFRGKRETRSVKLKDGETVSVDTGYGPRRLKYETELGRKVQRASDNLDLVKRDGRELFAAASTWEPKPLRKKKVDGPVIHFRNEGAESVHCSVRGCPAATSNIDEVTCARCVKRWKKYAEEKAKKEAEIADSKTLASFLEKNGPSPAKVIKAELDWDTKRLNRAHERGRRNNLVETDWSKPTRYMTHADYEAYLEEMRNR